MLLFFVVPTWTACCIVPRLAWLTNPVLRADLAVTPQDPAAFLWEKLKWRVFWGFLPGMLGLVALVFVVSIEAALSAQRVDGARAAVTNTVTIIAGLAALVPPLESAVAFAVALATARRACDQSCRLNPWTSGLLAAVLAPGVVAAWLIATGWIIQELVNSHVLYSSLLFIPLPISMYIFGRIVLLRALREWRGLAEVYLDIEPATIEPPK